VPQEEIAETLDDAICFAEKVGFPVVLKVDSPDLPHKTEAGAVRLGLKTKDEVRVAYQEILDSVSRFKPDAQINGVLVQEQIPPGVELIIGLGTDLQFGKTILVGMGGVQAEIMEDVALRLLPITELDAEEMLGELRISRVLKGFRGRGPSDESSLIHTLVALSDMGCIYGDHIKELDVNPLIVGPEGGGVTAVDALIVPGNLQLNA
jgi:acetyltransferase